MALPRSGPNSYHSPIWGRATSSIRTAAIPFEKHLVFGGDWYFYKDGIVDVKDRFQTALQTEGKVAKCEWNDESYTFDITCNPRDAKLVHHLFLPAISDVIREEEEKNGIREAVIGRRREHAYSDSDSDSSVYSGSIAADLVDEDGPIKSWKIQRLTVWMAQQGLQLGPQLGVTTQESDDSVKIPVDHYPPEVSSLQFKHAWRSGTDLPIVTDSDLQQLSQLTGCQLVKGPDDDVVYIGATTRQSVHLAILKLDNILKYSGPKTHEAHLFYAEETQNFELSFKYLTRVKISKKKIFQTTLLDNVEELFSETNNYGNLDQALTILCAPWVPNSLLPHQSQYVPTSAIKLPLPTPMRDNEDKGKDNEREEWIGFVFNRPMTSDNPLRHFPLQQENPVNEVVEKTTKVKEPGVVHQLCQLEINPKVAEIERWNAEVAPLSLKPAKIEPPVASGKPAWDTCTEWGCKPSESAAPLTQPQPPAASTGKSPFSPTSISHEFLTAPTSQDQEVGVRKPEGTKAPRKVSVGDRHSASMKPTSDSIPMHAGTAHMLSPNNSIYASVLDGCIPNLEIKFKPLIPTRQSPDQQSSVDSLQAVDEVSTRTYQNTMNQKTGKPKNLPAKTEIPTEGRLPLPSEQISSEDTRLDPSPGFVEALTTSFDMMVEQIRGFRGAVTIQAEFGRILVRNVKSNVIADKDMPGLTIDPNKVDFLLKPSPFPRGSQPSVSFTNKLTTLAIDADDLVKMKKSDGQPLWDARISYPWEIVYEFIFHDVEVGMPPEQFTIEIDGEGFSSRIKLHKDLGSIFVHGTKRHWDFRVIASGVEDSEDLVARYRPLEAAIRESLFIPPNVQIPELCFQLSRSLRSKFKLDEIRVHRISRYRSKDHNSVLQISEIQALDTNSRVVPNKDLVVFKAWFNTSELRKPLQKLDRWFQASISSCKADEMLKENETLELGDEASWTPASLARGDTVKALAVPACEMLKLMDAIGYDNDNGVERQPRHPQIQPSTAAEAKAPVREVFW